MGFRKHRKSFRNLSGILAGNSLEETQLVMSCVSRLVKLRATGGFAGREGTVTFDTIVTITSQYLKLTLKGKHQVLMLYHLIETLCQM